MIIGKSHRGTTHARCSYCGIDINISQGGKNDVEKHVGTSGNVAAVHASKGSANLSSFLQLESSQEGSEAVTRWAQFLTKHNVAYLASDHTSKFFKKIYPDSKIAKNFGCARTKATTTVKEGLASHYIKNLAASLAS